MISSSIHAHWDHANMLAHFLEVYISLHIVVAATSVTSASSAFFASAAWWLNSWSLINIFIFACFNKCWRMLNHHDQKIWCCRCIHCLSVVMTHTCSAFIKCARKCKHCFVKKNNCVMNLVLCSLLNYQCDWSMRRYKAATLIKIHVI